MVFNIGFSVKMKCKGDPYSIEETPFPIEQDLFVPVPKEIILKWRSDGEVKRR